MIYLDSSALVKLVLAEPGSKALHEHLLDHRELIQLSSELAKVEVIRALIRLGAEAEVLAEAKTLLRNFARLPIGSEIDQATTLPGKDLRSLDALHLATARMLGPALSQFITYDKRLAKAALDAGLPVVTPGEDV
jgi:predicted nucleic acid-binding protein